MTELSNTLAATRAERDEWHDKFCKLRDEMLDHRRISALELGMAACQYGASSTPEQIIERAELFFKFLV